MNWGKTLFTRIKYLFYGLIYFIGLSPGQTENQFATKTKKIFRQKYFFEYCNYCVVVAVVVVVVAVANGTKCEEQRNVKKIRET